MTYGNAPRTQAEWDAKRAEAKAEAAEVVKANAKEALEAKKAFQRRNDVPHSIDTITEPGEVQADPDSTVALHVEPANAEQTHSAERYPNPVQPEVNSEPVAQAIDQQDLPNRSKSEE